MREATYRRLGSAVGEHADIGCGTGRVVADLSRLGRNVVGVDSSQTMVDAALTRFPHCRIVSGGACDLPFGDGEFDSMVLGSRLPRTTRAVKDAFSPAIPEPARGQPPGGRTLPTPTPPSS